MAEESLWPRLPTEDEARAALSHWAREKATIPDGTFDGPLQPRSETVAKFSMSRVIETREEIPGEVAGSSAPSLAETYQGDVTEVPWAPPTAPRNEERVLLKEGSVETRDCGYCNAGTHTCPRCQGSRKEACPTTERCTYCHGSGKVASQSQGNYRSVTCRRCQGDGERTCSICNGRGIRTCQGCQGGGFVRCEQCAGSGFKTSFMRGHLRREVAKQEVGGADSTRPYGKALTKAKTVSIQLQGDQVPAWLPAGPAQDLKRVMPEEPGEVFRHLEIQVVPITAVDYKTDKGITTAYLLGQDGFVFAPDALARRRRTGLLATLAVVVLASLIAAVIWFVLSRGGDSPSLGSGVESPSAVASSVPVADAGLERALALVDEAGLRALDWSPFRPSQTYSSRGIGYIIATGCAADQNSCYDYRTVYFADGELVRWDVAGDEPVGYAAPPEVNLKSYTGTARYPVLKQGDPLCCPSRYVKVRLRFADGALVGLNKLPSPR